MSVYDYRDRPAYDTNIVPYKNRNISKWWTSAHDKLLEDLIQKEQWHWSWGILYAIVKITPKEIVESLSKQYAYYNKVIKFALSRAKELGLTEKIRKPQWKVCPICKEKLLRIL